VEKLKRAVIKEELVALTGNFVEAVLLNQLIYWSERVNDFDKFIEEEKSRREDGGAELESVKLNGWIYKTAEELSRETMLGLSSNAIRAHLKRLIEAGWIDERTNPQYKWDKTKQYRVNILKVQRDLKNRGYTLDGYRVDLSEIANASDEARNAESASHNSENEFQTSENFGTIPENTTENTTEITTKNVKDISSLASKNNEDLFEEKTEEENTSKGRAKGVPYSEIVDLYNELCPSLPSVKQLTDKRKRKLKTLWEFVGGDIEQIRTVFENAEDSEFLSGRNDKWTGCNFDWLINTNNFVKVLEGSYNDRSGLRRMPGDDAFGIKAYLRREQEELERKSKNKDPAGIKAYLREHGYDSILAEVEAKEREVAG